MPPRLMPGRSMLAVSTTLEIFTVTPCPEEGGVGVEMGVGEGVGAGVGVGVGPCDETEVGVKVMPPMLKPAY